MLWWGGGAPIWIEISRIAASHSQMLYSVFTLELGEDGGRRWVEPTFTLGAGGG